MSIRVWERTYRNGPPRWRFDNINFRNRNSSPPWPYSNDFAGRRNYAIDQLYYYGRLPYQNMNDQMYEPLGEILGEIPNTLKSPQSPNEILDLPIPNDNAWPYCGGGEPFPLPPYADRA